MNQGHDAAGVRVAIHAAGRLPDGVEAFWKAQQKERDGHILLTASPAWFRMLAEEGGVEGHVAAMSDGEGHCVGVVAYFIRPVRTLAARLWSPFRPVSAVWVFSGDVLVQTDKLCELNCVWEAILAAHPGVSMVILDHVADERRLLQIEAGTKGSRILGCVRWFRHRPHYFLLLPSSWEACSRIRSKRSARRIAKHERGLAQELGGEPLLVELRTAEELAQWRSRLESLAGRAWQARRLGHRLDIPAIERLAGRGWVRLFLLVGHETPLAYVLCYQGEDSIIREQSGYDPSHAAWYPGELLLFKMLRKLYDGPRPAVVDYGVGESYQKREFATERREVSGVFLVRRGTAAGMVAVWWVTAGMVGRGWRRVLARLGLKRSFASWARRRGGAGRDDGRTFAGGSS